MAVEELSVTLAAVTYGAGSVQVPLRALTTGTTDVPTLVLAHLPWSESLTEEDRQAMITAIRDAAGQAAAGDQGPLREVLHLYLQKAIFGSPGLAESYRCGLDDLASGRSKRFESLDALFADLDSE